MEVQLYDNWKLVLLTSVCKESTIVFSNSILFNYLIQYSHRYFDQKTPQRAN